jgi:hypothetical protein
MLVNDNMVAADSSLDMNQIVQEYVADHDWERDKTHVQNTSTAVQLLVRAIVDTGDISESAMRTVYNICQNNNALKPSTKKQRIADLAIDEEAKSRLVDMVDEGTGIVGKGTYSVPIEGYEEEAFELLSTAIQSENRESIDAAIEDFAALDIDGVQAGIVSTILYFLNPTIYPISNKRSRTGMEQYFDYDMSAQLTGYIEDVDKFEEVRANYSFDSDYRHVDSFFNWIAKQDIGEDEDKSSTNSDDHNEVDTSSPSETLTEYWQEISDKEQAAEEFLQDPTSERFKEWIETFPWFVSRFTDAEEVLTDTTPENVAELLKQGATTGSLNKALELPGFGVAAATEALAILEPERFVALNNRAESGLEALQFNPPNPGVTSIRRYEEFSNQVDEAIDKYDFRSIVDDAPQWATPYQIATCAFYRHSEDQIDLTELLPDSETQSPNKDQSPQTEDIDYYWVNQNREIELREGYLRSQDQQWQRDLTVLEPGDIVFHYTDQAIRACSVVTKEAYQTEMDSGEYYRVEVSTNNLDTPLPLSNVRDALQDPDRRQDQNRYPLDKNGNVIQAYLCHLSSAAGEYLLKEANVDLPGGPTSSSKNYFWATANPSIWSVDEIAEGGDVLYTAYNGPIQVKCDSASSVDLLIITSS